MSHQSEIVQGIVVLVQYANELGLRGVEIVDVDVECDEDTGWFDVGFITDEECPRFVLGARGNA